MLSSEAGAVSPPRVRTGSSTVIVVAFTVVVVPFTVRLPVTTVLAFLIVQVPVVEPIVTAVPAAAKFTVVGDASRLKVDAVVVKSPPLTARSPVRVVSPATLSCAPIPTPPVTTKAPLLVAEESVAFVNDVIPVVPKVLLICVAPVIVAAPPTLS